MKTQTKTQELNRMVYSALRIFLFNAVIVYSIGLAYAVFFRVTLIMIMIPIAVAVIALVVYYLFRKGKNK